MNTVVWRSTYEGPKWAGLPSFIKNKAHLLGVSVDLDCDKGWIFESIRLTARGDEENVRKLKRIINQAVNSYNNQ